MASKIMTGFTIGPGKTRGYTFTWSVDTGWPGITIIQPQPTWSDALGIYPPPSSIGPEEAVILNYNQNSVNYNAAYGTYGVNWSITNNSKWVITFDVWLSTI